MNLDKIKDEKMSVDASRGLNFEENLLFEKESGDESGVDFEDVQVKSRTGLTERKNIGLPNLSEPQVVRHFVRLSQKNFAIDSGFYPLGSCTMKHNPRINEKVARFAGFANLHPLQDDSTTQGALELMYKLQEYLAEVSGLPAVTLNPAAGAHGEMAGMLVIRKRHDALGNKRSVVLVPESAHGTNPATAAFCGYKTKEITATKEGTVDIQAFKDALNDDVAALMLTNPNTCGLFESDVKEISELLKKNGSYLYCDGANFNAIVGKVRPGDFGADVMHFNLHKTFSTPHGGGGPGSGPIAVTEELRPYLPVPLVVKNGDTYSLTCESEETIGRMKGFNGQFGMFVRAYAYILSHGADGLKQVAEDAVLNANYILSKLKNYYHVPFDGTCMHECLLTDKHQKEHGVATYSIAKTLIEYGMHPMTVYFPLVVQGAMLIEPTETETKASIDRFIDVMKMIAIETAKGNGEQFTHNPVSTPRMQLDETSAARNPVLRWND